jgi:hypothetical protein
MLVGHVTWQGPPPQPDVLQQLPVTITLKLGNTETDYPADTTDGSGFFTTSIGTLPNGTYSWRVKGPKYLANSGQVALSGDAATQLEMGLMRAGDCNDDNRITAIDFSILKVTLGKSVGQPGYDDRAEFTGDGVVTIADFNFIRNGFGMGGAPPLSP